MTLKRQTGKIWHKQDGIEVEVKRITKHEKIKEVALYQIAKESLILEAMLTKLKKITLGKINEIQTAADPADKTCQKTSFTSYNFDKSIRLTVKQGVKMTLDPELMIQAKSRFDAFLTRAINTKDRMIEQIIMGAFETRGGRPDPVKVLNLLSYKQRTENTDFITACGLLEKAIDKQITKKYIGIEVLQDDGSYRDVCLSFAAIKLPETAVETITPDQPDKKKTA